MRIYGLKNSSIWLSWLVRVWWSILAWIALWAITIIALSKYLIANQRIWEYTWSILSFVPTVIWTSLLILWISSFPIWLSMRSWPLALLDSSPKPLLTLLSRKNLLAWILLLIGSYRLIVTNLLTASLHIWIVFILGAIIGVFVWIIHKSLFWSANKAWRRKSRFLKRDILRFLQKPWTQSNLITWWCTILFILLSRVVMWYTWLQERLNWLTEWWDALFVTNVFDDDLAKIDQLSFEVDDVFDIILGRIVNINGSSLDQHFKNKGIRGEQQRGFTREFNMTSSILSEIPIASWETLSAAEEISLDQEFADELMVDLWDEINISISWREFSFIVTNIRSSVRDGVSPFFYFQLYAPAFTEAPKTSFFQISLGPEEKTRIKNEIISVMGNNISFIDTGEIIQEAKTYIDRIKLPISWLFLLMTLYALGAIFSLFRYAWIFQKPRFDVYKLIWASNIQIQSLKRGYISIYLLIAWTLTLVSFLWFWLIFRNSTFIDSSKLVFGIGILTILWVSILIWLITKSSITEE